MFPAAAAGAAAFMAWAVRGRSSSVFGPSAWRGPRHRRAVALTFDDGPSESTPRVLEVLDRHRVPATFFQIGSNVERLPGVDAGVGPRTVPAEAFGAFLCTIFDEWLREDIGRVKVQIFEEAAATAMGQEHSLCVFRKMCGDVPVIEHNGDFFSCDHFVDNEHRLGNILEIPLVELLESQAQRAFGQIKSDGLPGGCQACEVLPMCNGGCPKDRFLLAPDSGARLNYLCAGYKRFFNHCRPFMEQLAALARQMGSATF